MSDAKVKDKTTPPNGQDDAAKAAAAAAEAAKKKVGGKSGKSEGGDDDGGAGDDDIDPATGKKRAAEGSEGGDDDGDKGGGDDDADWRDRLADGDAELRKQLDRYTSEADAGRALKNAWAKIREKGGVSLPGDDAKPEDVAAFYNQNLGRPEKFEDLKVEPKLPDGEAFTDDEAGVVAGVMGALHKAVVFGKPQFDAAAQIVADLLVGGRKEVESRAAAIEANNEKELRKAWPGKDFDANVSLANAYMKMRCAEVGVDPSALGELKLADGTRLGNNPLYARVAAAGGRASAEDPNLPTPDNGGGATLEKMESELETLMKKMNGTEAEKREYETADKDKRNKLRENIKRAKGTGRKA